MVTDRIKIGGGVTFWRFPKLSNIATIRCGLAMEGLDEFTPKPRPPKSLLRAALGDVYRPANRKERLIVQPLPKKTGWAVVKTRRDEEKSAGDGWGTVVATADLDKSNKVSLDPWDYDKLEAIKDAMESQAQWATATAVGKSLIRLIEHMGGVALRPSGGVYWVNEAQMDLWAKVGDVFEEASANTGNEKAGRVYVLKVMADEQMIRAVGDALTDDIEMQLAKIEQELMEADMTVGKAIKRMERADKLHDKVTAYEAAFGAPLAKLQSMIERVAGNAAMASLQASASSGPVLVQ